MFVSDKTSGFGSHCEKCVHLPGSPICNSHLGVCKKGSEGYYKADAKSALDVQEGGTHYKNMKIQPVEYCQKNGLRHCESSIVKYASRHLNKNGAEDVRKIIHYAKLLLELEYGEVYEDNQL